MSEIAVELAEQCVTVFLSAVGEVRDEAFHLFAGSFAKRLDAAEVRCIRLDQVGIELMLANDLTETVADFGASVVPIAIGRLWRKFLRLSGGLRWLGEGPDFLDRADADSVCLAQGAVHGSGFRDSHFGAVNKERNIGGIGVTITNKSFAIAGLKDCGFECPSCRTWVGKFSNVLYSYSGTLPPLSDS